MNDLIIGAQIRPSFLAPVEPAWILYRRMELNFAKR